MPSRSLPFFLSLPLSFSRVRTFAPSLFRFLFSFVSLSFFLSTLSGLPLRLRQRSTLFDPSLYPRPKSLSDSSFILPSYFTYLLTLSFFLLLHRFFLSSLSFYPLLPLRSFSRLRLLCRQSRFATWNCPKNRLRPAEKESKREEEVGGGETKSDISCFFVLFLFFSLLS